MSDEALSSILMSVGWSAGLAAGVEFSGGADPILPTPFRIGETAAAAVGAVGLGVSALWELRVG